MSENGPQPEPLAVEPVDDLHALAFAATEAEPQEQLFRRAELTSRLMAAAMDALVFGVVLFALMVVAYWTGIADLLFGNRRGSSAESLAMLITMHLWIAMTLTEVFGTATPGKYVLDIKITSAYFTPAFARQRLARWAVRRLPDLMVLVIAWIEFLDNTLQLRLQGDFFRKLYIGMLLVFGIVFLAFLPSGDVSRQALYDRLFGTSVIEANASKGRRWKAFRVVTKDDSPGT